MAGDSLSQLGQDSKEKAEYPDELLPETTGATAPTSSSSSATDSLSALASSAATAPAAVEPVPDYKYNASGMMGATTRAMDYQRKTAERDINKLNRYVQTKIIGEELPPTYDNINMIVGGIKYLDRETSQRAGFNTDFFDTINVLLTPEILQAFVTQAKDVAVEHQAAYEEAYANDPVLAMFAYGNTSEFMRATVGSNPTPYEPVSVDEQPNVVALMDSPHLKSDFRDWYWSAISSLPADQRMSREERVALADSQLGTGFGVPSYEDIQEQEAQFANVRGSGLRNYREEAAAQIFYYLEETQPQTEEEERAAITYAWKVISQKEQEIKAREGHLGDLGDLFDIPKFAMTAAANKALVSHGRSLAQSGLPFTDRLSAPNDSINHAHVSFGQNTAMLMGLSDADTARIDDSWLGKAVSFGLEFGPSAHPVGVGVFAYRAGRSIISGMQYQRNEDGSYKLDDDGEKIEVGYMMGTPGWSPMVSEFRSGNTYQWVSGMTDLMTWIYLDPVNYAFNIGMGFKAVKTIPKVAKLSRASLAWRSLVPVYGKYATNVFNAPTARLTHSLFAKTIDGTVDGFKAHRSGRAFFELAQSSDNWAEFMRKSTGLNEQAASALWHQAQSNDYDMFFETIRVNMHGGGDLTNLPQASKLKAMLDAGDTKFHQAVQRGLDSGQIGIRDAIDPTTGVTHRDPFIMATRPAVAIDETAPGFINTGVEARQFKNGPRMATSPLVGEYATKAGRVEIRGAGDTFAAFKDGEFLGMVEHATSTQRQIAVLPEHRRQGVGTLLRSMAGENPARAEDVSGSAEVAFYGGGPDSIRILTRSVDEGDGLQKVAINSKRGFNVVEASDANLLKWLTDNKHMDLAAKLQAAAEDVAGDVDQMSIFGFRISELSDDEIKILKTYIDDVSDAHGFGHGEELLLGSGQESKLLRGIDAEVRVPIQEALPDEAARQAMNWSYRQQVETGGRTNLTLINQLPRQQGVATRWAQGVIAASRINSSGSVARFSRKIRHGVQVPWSVNIEVGNVSQGYKELESNMMLLGVSPKRRDQILTMWGDAKTVEERVIIAKTYIADIADDANIQGHVRLGLNEHSKLHGEQRYHTGPSGEDVGAWLAADGTSGVSSPILAMRSRTVVQPNLNELMRQSARFKRAQRLPGWWKKGVSVGWLEAIGPQPMRKLVNGLGKPRANRKQLVKNYKAEIRRSGVRLPENWDDDDYLSLAYADVMGYRIDGNGLGLVNKAFSAAGSAYGAFHSMFSIAQLAFRPLPWAGRVLMEEQVRSWMMGVPSIYRNPVMYSFGLVDAHWTRVRANKMEMQRVRANRSAVEIFDPKVNSLDEAIAAADEIIPGFKARIGRSDLSSMREIEAAYEHALHRSLIGAPQSLEVQSRGNMAMRTMFRKNRITNANERLVRKYGLERTWEWETNVPEIINKSNVWLISDEMQSSIRELKFSDRLRPRDIRAYADSWLKKAQQFLGDPAGNYALKRMADRAQGIQGTHSAEGFSKTHAWAEMKDQARSMARHRGLNVDTKNAADYLDDVGLARFYLDTIVGEELVGSIVRPLWNGDMAAKQRILRELAESGRTTVGVEGSDYALDLRRGEYAGVKSQTRDFFRAEHSAGHFEYAPVAGYFHPLYGQGDTKNRFRKATNWILQTFGEDASQAFHRQPAYLFQRQQWLNNYKRLGWSEEAASHLAHQKAFEMVNYTYFNNRHTGYIINRMNKAIPFFAAQMEVLSTWAWKIPRQNFLPLGYARMIHNMDKIMQGFAKMGLVEINQDGQWALNAQADPGQLSPAGRGLSVGMHSWMRSPLAVVEQVFNITKAMTSGHADPTEYMGIDWRLYDTKDYKLPIGSPVALGSRGLMGVNQLEMGSGPVINLGMTKGLDFLKTLPFAGDRELVSGATLADMYEQLPDDVALSQFLEVNARTLREHLGPEQHNLLYKDEGYYIDPDKIDVAGLSLQVPGSSLFDTWQYEQFEDILFPFGHINTPQGLIRSLQPAGISYMLRGMTGMMADEGELPEGLLATVLGPMDDFQIKSQLVKAWLHLESTEGLGTRIMSLSEEISNLYIAEGYGSVEEFTKKYDMGSEAGKRFVELVEERDSLNDEVIKRATDIAGNSIFARGLMGFVLPSTPKMLYREESAIGQFYGTKDIAAAASVRGSLDWGEAIASLDVRTDEDLERVMGLMASWLQDPEGGTAKTWFNEQYPELMVWLQPTTFWGPIGQPAEAENFDRWFEDMEAGRKQPLPPDVAMQRAMRTSVSVGHEANLVLNFGNDYIGQGVGALNEWDKYLDLVEEKRGKLFALDMWDDDLNGSSYSDWRGKNEAEAPVVYERVLDELYNLRDAVDDILSLVDHADMSPEDVKVVNQSLRSITREYIAATNEILDELRNDDGWRNPREEIISRYFAEVAGPYYEKAQTIYDKLDDAETKQDESFVYEEVKLLRNEMFLSNHRLLVDGEAVTVPDELSRSWSNRSPEEQTFQIMQWTTRPVEWLDLFSAQKVVEEFPQAEAYIPTTPAQMRPYEIASRAKVEIYNYSRENVEGLSTYRRNQAIEQWDEWLKAELTKEGRHSEIAWLDSWPIEKLGLTGQLPRSLEQVARWFVGIKNELNAIDGGVGPTSQEGRVRLNNLFFVLRDQYFPENPEARRAFEQLGEQVFGESGMAAIMARLYGSYSGELN